VWNAVTEVAEPDSRKQHPGHAQANAPDAHHGQQQPHGGHQRQHQDGVAGGLPREKFLSRMHHKWNRFRAAKHGVGIGPGARCRPRTGGLSRMALCAQRVLAVPAALWRARRDP
jgi:hypothetical protein